MKGAVLFGLALCKRPRQFINKSYHLKPALRRGTCTCSSHLIR